MREHAIMMHHQNDAERRILEKKMTAALTFRAESDFIDAIQSYSEKAGLSVNAALKEIIAPVIGFARRRSNTPRNNLASFCGALKDVDCSELEATQAAFSEIDAKMWK